MTPWVGSVGGCGSWVIYFHPRSGAKVPLALFFSSLGSWRHFCGGSIITQWTIITAAHCFMDFDEHPHNFTTAFTRIITGLHIAKLPEIQNSFSEWNTSVQEIILTYTKKSQFPYFLLCQIMPLVRGVVWGWKKPRDKKWKYERNHRLGEARWFTDLPRSDSALIISAKHRQLNPVCLFMSASLVIWGSITLIIIIIALSFQE